MQIDNWPDKRYDLIYADPPWKYEFGFSSRSVENHYPTMDLDDIKALPIVDLANDNCVLYLWTSAPKLDQAMEVINVWGFKY